MPDLGKLSTIFGISAIFFGQLARFLELATLGTLDHLNKNHDV